jgi:hypothetical protein
MNDAIGRYTYDAEENINLISIRDNDGVEPKATSSEEPKGAPRTYVAVVE